MASAGTDRLPFAFRLTVGLKFALDVPSGSAQAVWTICDVLAVVLLLFRVMFLSPTPLFCYRNFCGRCCLISARSGRWLWNRYTRCCGRRPSSCAGAHFETWRIDRKKVRESRAPAIPLFVCTCLQYLGAKDTSRLEERPFKRSRIYCLRNSTHSSATFQTPRSLR